MSQDPAMIQAYKDGKDLYAVIAQSMYNNNYEDNLEFYPEGTEIEQNGMLSVSGSGKEYNFELDNDNTITVPYFYLLQIKDGVYKTASTIDIGTIIFAESVELKVISKKMVEKKVILQFDIC